MQQAFWGEVPYHRYLFLNVLSETRGGLEHLDSTLMMSSRWATSSRDDYLSWLGLVSHEFFQFVTFVWPVEPGGNEDCDSGCRNSRCQQTLDQRSQEHRIGHRTGDIADGDTRGPCTCRDVTQRAGCNRLVQCMDNSSVRIRQNRHGRFPHDSDVGAVRQSERSAVASVSQFEFHGRIQTGMH